MPYSREAISWLALVIALALVAPAAPETDHHEHPGITDAQPDDVGHHHGDADDHHESSNSPCHPHVVHCDCVLGVVGLIPAGSGVSRPEPAGLAPIAAALQAIASFAPPIFHVPIA